MRSRTSGAHMSAGSRVGVGTESVDSRLVIVKVDPLNAESPLAEQIGVITPTSLFYVRNNFAVPQVNAASWVLAVEGGMKRPYQITYEELRAMPSRTLTSTLECAGNGRTSLSPIPEGEPWGYGAVSTAEWTGTPLAAILERAGVDPGACEILVEGSDQGTVATRTDAISFSRSLPLEKALHPDTLLVYAMNGEPLTPQHGHPVRLLVPGWYGMASVKWIRRISALTEPFDGYYQRERYILDRGDRDVPDVPLRIIRVRSLILSPASDTNLPRGQHRIHGATWSGAADVTQVDVSTDNGYTWAPAEFVSHAAPYTWRRWEFTWEAHATGQFSIRSRACDAHGNRQPGTSEWNRLGYANNAIQVVSVRVVDR